MPESFLIKLQGFDLQHKYFRDFFQNLLDPFFVKQLRLPASTSRTSSTNILPSNVKKKINTIYLPKAIQRNKLALIPDLTARLLF